MYRKTSGQYTIDPDGILVGEPPITAYCRFDEDGGVVTEIFHDTEDLSNVDKCPEPGCYSKTINYTSGVSGETVPLTQLDALLALASSCEQSFDYTCMSAPLRTAGQDYGYWTGRDGEENVYFTRDDASLHACDCHFTKDGCKLKTTSCNCDSSFPVPLLDTGLISNMSALPIISIAFGGLQFAGQQAAYKIGRLSCRGEKSYEKATSCQALKLAGETTSGYFTLKKKESLHTSSVYCDLSKGGYTDVTENTEISTDSPLGTIVAWLPRNSKTATKNSPPDGWLPCDGRKIFKGPWSGGKTPKLNDGRFLRGGSEDNALEMEEDTVINHKHIDPGHTHGNDPHSHSYIDKYGSKTKSPKGTYAYSSYGDHNFNTDKTTITIAEAQANIGLVSSEYKSGSETRPRNMKVTWIIKVW